MIQKPCLSLIAIVALLAAAPPAASQETLILHARFNPASPPVADTLHMYLIPFQTYTSSFVDTSNHVLHCPVAVGPTTTPTDIRDAFVASAAGTGLGVSANAPDVWTVNSSMPLSLAVRTDGDLIGPSPTDALMVYFQFGVGGVADGIPNNSVGSPCTNATDAQPLPYPGAGFCFIEHLDSVHYGEGNFRDFQLLSGVAGGVLDRLDKDVSIAAGGSLVFMSESPGMTLNGTSYAVFGCVTNPYFTHFLSFPNELDIFAMHFGTVVVVGYGAGFLPGTPVLGPPVFYSIPITTALTPLIDSTLVLQAVCADPTALNGWAVTNNVRHDFIP